MAYLGVKPAGISSASQVETDKLTVNGNAEVTGTSALTGAATFTAGFTASDGCTITTATDADGSSGPHLVLQRDSSSPADNDLLGQILFRGEDDGSNVVEACEMKVTARDVTNGTEDSQLDITTQVAGTARSRMVMNEVETVFNQDSQDIDFRVESDGNANMLVVDSGNNRVGIGTSSPSNTFQVNGDGARFANSSDTDALHLFEFNGSNHASYAAYTASGNNNVKISTSEASFFNGGHVGIGTTAPSNGQLCVENSDNENTGFFHNTNSGFSSTNVQISTSRNTTGGAYNHLACSIHGVSTTFIVYDGGNVVNSNNSYGQISDQRLKENIADASSQWDDIKALQVRNFNFIGDDLNQIGVVAQEVEAAGMNGLIQEAAWFNAASNPDSEVRKTVKYSVLYMKAVKALQEAMTRIETLETQNTTQATQIADLITRVTALEDA